VRSGRLGLLLAAALDACTPTPEPAARAPGLHPEVQGHRGCRGLRPENTLPAFEHAIALGVDVLELDLALSRDDVLVVVHDPEVNPDLCVVDPAHPLPSRRFRDLRFDEIATLDCGSRRNPRFPEQTLVPGARIPRFEQVLALLERHPRLRLNAEIKTSPEQREVTRPPGDFARVLVARVTERGLARRVLVQSFDAEALRAVGRLGPDLERVALVDRLDQLEPMLSTGARVLSPRASLLRQGDVERYHRRGLRVIPWTVNDVQEMRKLIAWRVDGIITDRPDVLLTLLP
jgi:glycerophosphoryl diester phosphodiesterase